MKTTYKFNLWTWIRFQLAALLGRNKFLNIVSTFEIDVPEIDTPKTMPTGLVRPSAWRAGGICVCGHEGFLHSFDGSFPCDKCDCTVYVENSANS